MFDKITQKAKSNPSYGILYITIAALILLFAALFSFCILQSDDYSYAAYFKNGLIGFIKLTKEHFLNINGRALVHFFLQVTLALPTFLVVLIKSAILFAVGFFSFKASPLRESSLKCTVYFIAFYCFILLWGNNTLKEAIMWSSGFFNYIFPAFFVFFALYLHTKGSKWQYLFCFLAGATTEQWGFAAIAIITGYIVFSPPSFKIKNTLITYLPTLLTASGYITIFTSPATLSRLFVSGHATVTESLFDIPRLSRVFLCQGSATAIIIIFILAMLLTGFIKKGCYQALYAGLLPLVLILSLPLHHSYMAAFIILCCYICLCAVLLLSEKHTFTGSVFSGALAAILIMLPTNTFDYRIISPCALLLTIGSIMLVLELNLPLKALTWSTLSLLLIALLAFSPSLIGFYRNFAIEKDNLHAIEKARDTRVLNYNIDYNKNYAVRQMFNDGWFYNAFVSLYDLETCSIYLDSKNAKTLYLNNKAFKSKAIISENEAYVPLRAFINEAGGSIFTKKGVEFILNDKALTYLDGILMYTNPEGHEKYLIADDFSLPDFYTLYVKLDIICDAFNISLSVDKS